MLLVLREFKSDEHVAVLKDGCRLSLSRCLALLSLLLVSSASFNVSLSNFGFNVSEISEHRNVKLLNISLRPSHFLQLFLGLSRKVGAFLHGGSNDFLPSVLAEVRTDRV